MPIMFHFGAKVNKKSSKAKINNVMHMNMFGSFFEFDSNRIQI